MDQFTITEDFPKNQAAFDTRFSTEEACQTYLYELRWPDGFKCIRCGETRHWKSNRGLYICFRCEHQHSITAGTIMAGTRKPLVLWFKAMWWFTTRKSGVNAINLQDLLGLGSYHTAWRWLQKLRSCTIRQNREKLSGKVEVDEFYLGGEYGGGKRGRGAEHKCAVAIAVERKGRKLGRIRLQLIDDCSSGQLIPFMINNVSQGSVVTTDGWKGYNDLDSEGYDHLQVVRSKTLERESVLSGAHLVISLIKRLMIGTFQGRFERKYLQRYLDEYVFRFNRRATASVGKRFYRIVQQAVATKALPKKQIILGVPSLGLAG
ncbi:IS1595 family transposase [Desulfosarcina widdelii]|uniref:IS1595 family transposase n=1 Tax=Desulfosarcina widdelii TaxID=947919 RepID=A0A5K7YYT8_9BACT|nr:IS1595 family transposase [Desulfosarcina widdelii]BBO73083.1 IS1595 family transposase [Desulfosarcina widdelii]